MNSKFIIQLVAVFAIAMMLVPQFVAATETSVSNEVTIAARSAHDGEYDEVSNIANDSAQTNKQTWDPVAQGSWVGGQTKESLFKFNEVTSTVTTVGTAYSSLILSWEAKFSAEQIMSGASSFVLRLPIYSDPVAVESVGLKIFAIDATENYVFTLRDDAYPHGHWEAVPVFSPHTDGYEIYYQDGMDCSDVSVTDGDNCYTSANRMYVEVNAPIQTEQIYLFVVDVQYVSDQRFKVYVSPNDVASDSLLNSHFVRYVPTAPDTVSFVDDRQNIDLGASYDFRTGMGGNVWAQDFYLAAGDVILIYSYSKNAPGTNGYHTIMIPFRSATSTAQFSIRAWADNSLLGALTPSINTNSTTYYNYILQSGLVPYNATATAGGEYYTVQLTSTIDQRITFMFEDLPNIAQTSSSLSWMHWASSTFHLC